MEQKKVLILAGGASVVCTVIICVILILIWLFNQEEDTTTSSTTGSKSTSTSTSISTSVSTSVTGSGGGGTKRLGIFAISSVTSSGFRIKANSGSSNMNSDDPVTISTSPNVPLSSGGSSTWGIISSSNGLLVTGSFTNGTSYVVTVSSTGSISGTATFTPTRTKSLGTFRLTNVSTSGVNLVSNADAQNMTGDDPITVSVFRLTDQVSLPINGQPTNWGGLSGVSGGNRITGTFNSGVDHRVSILYTGLPYSNIDFRPSDNRSLGTFAVSSLSTSGFRIQSNGDASGMDPNDTISVTINNGITLTGAPTIWSQILSGTVVAASSMSTTTQYIVTVTYGNLSASLSPFTPPANPAGGGGGGGTKTMGTFTVDYSITNMIRISRFNNSVNMTNDFDTVTFVIGGTTGSTIANNTWGNVKNGADLTVNGNPLPYANSSLTLTIGVSGATPPTVSQTFGPISTQADGGLCSSSADCNQGLRCVRSICKSTSWCAIPASDCSASNPYCVSNVCTSGQTNSPCNTSADCNSGLQCGPNPANRCIISPPPGPPAGFFGTRFRHCIITRTSCCNEGGARQYDAITDWSFVCDVNRNVTVIQRRQIYDLDYKCDDFWGLQIVDTLNKTGVGVDDYPDPGYVYKIVMTVPFLPGASTTCRFVAQLKASDNNVYLDVSGAQSCYLVYGGVDIIDTNTPLIRNNQWPATWPPVNWNTYYGSAVTYSC